MLANLDLQLSESHTYKQNRNKIHFSRLSSQLEAHFQSLCYSQQTLIARFAPHLDSFELFYEVERCYTEYLLGIAPLFLEALEIGILLALVRPFRFDFRLPQFPFLVYSIFLTCVIETISPNICA